MTAFEKLFGLIRKNEKRTGSDYTATVTRVKDGIAYVQITGAEITDTPVAMSVDAKAGDQVRVRVNGGKAWLTGNDTRPPNDSSTDIEKIMSQNKTIEENFKSIEKRLSGVPDNQTNDIGTSAVNTAFTNTGHYLSARIERHGNTVTLTGEIKTGSALNAAAYIAMFRLPSGYRPRNQTFFKAYREGGTTEVTFYTDPVDNDWVRLLVANSVTASTTYRFTVPYTT